MRPDGQLTHEVEAEIDEYVLAGHGAQPELVV